jgi:hypothetical protein
VSSKLTIDVDHLDLTHPEAHRSLQQAWMRRSPATDSLSSLASQVMTEDESDDLFRSSGSSGYHEHTPDRNEYLQLSFPSSSSAFHRALHQRPPVSKKRREPTGSHQPPNRKFKALRSNDCINIPHQLAPEDMKMSNFRMSLLGHIGSSQS